MKELGGIVGEFIGHWWHVGLTIIGGIGIAWVPLQLQRNPPPTEPLHRWLIVLLVVSCVLAGASAFVEKKLSKRREAIFVQEAADAYKGARADFYLAITETIPPNLEQLAKALEVKIAGTGTPPELIGNVLAHCRAFLSTNSNGGHVRANYYQLRGGRGARAKLVKADMTGGNSREEFTQSSKDPEGTAVVQTILARGTMFCPDVTDPEQISKFCLVADKPRDYKAFLTVPVATPEHIYGMLSVNALDGETLEAEDEKMLRLMAWLIITAEILAQDSGLTELPAPQNV
ncbi:GAF domain-containing protein [Arthrobacter sp. R1-13]